MRDSRTRSAVKALTWRTTALLLTVAAVFLLTGSVGKAAAIGAVDFIIKLVAFYGHERVWERVPVGR